METAVAAYEQISSDKIREYLAAFGLAEGLTPKEQDQFIGVAQAYQLNPFKREIYCVAYGKDEKRKLSIVTGFETYLKRAERTGKLDGWKVETKGSLEKKQVNKTGRNGSTWQVHGWRGDFEATLTIFRKDWAHPFTWTVKHDCVTKDENIWIQDPEHMTKKAVMGLGFRLCFPDELGGMPYTDGELPAEMTERNVTEPQGQQKEPEQTQPKAPEPPPHAPPFTPAARNPVQVRIDAAKASLSEAMGAIVDSTQAPVFNDFEKDLYRKDLEGGLTKSEKGRVLITEENALQYEKTLEKVERELQNRLADIAAIEAEAAEVPEEPAESPTEPEGQKALDIF